MEVWLLILIAASCLFLLLACFTTTSFAQTISRCQNSWFSPTAFHKFSPFFSGFIINTMAPFQDDLRWVCQHHRWTKGHHDFQLHNPSLSPWQVIFRSHSYPHQNHPHKVYVVNLIKIDPIHIYIDALSFGFPAGVNSATKKAILCQQMLFRPAKLFWRHLPVISIMTGTGAV